LFQLWILAFSAFATTTAAVEPRVRILRPSIGSSAPTNPNQQRLSLGDAIRLALQKNPQMRLADALVEEARIAYDIAWDAMYLPNVTLQAASVSDFTVGAIGGTPGKANLSQYRNRGYPNSAVTLSLGNYVLFNFWKDSTTLESARYTRERAELQASIARRNVRFRVINAYFRAKVDQERAEAAKRSFAISQTILDLVRSRARIGQATQEDFSSSSVDVLNAKIEMDQVQSQFKTSLLSLNAIIAAPSEQSFNLTSPVDFKAITLTPERAAHLFLRGGPALANQKYEVQVAENTLDLAHKNRLPLPTISFSGINVTYANGIAGGTPSYTTPSGRNPGGQLDIEASINLTLPLVGGQGFLNSRTLSLARIAVERSEALLHQAQLDGELNVRTLVVNIQQIESRIESLKQALDANGKILDLMLDKIRARRATRLELRDAIEQLRFSVNDYLETSFFHISQKNALLEQLGMDDDREL
jgi:outer membrane protein TolC